MKKLMNWMQNVFAPKMNKVCRNPYIAGIQDAILTSMPMILAGSLFCVIASLFEKFEWAGQLWTLNTFTIGLLSLYLAYFIPSSIMDKMKLGKTKRQAGMLGISSFLILLGVGFNEDGAFVIESSAVGTGGMLVAIVSGIFVAFIMSLFAKHSFFKKGGSGMPDFITVWFDTLIPFLLVVGIEYILVYVLGLNINEIVYSIFSPIQNAGDSFLGFVLLFFFEYTFIYSFGISTWVLYPIQVAIQTNAYAINQAAIAAGGEATVMNTWGIENYFTMGGGGVTLALGLMMLLLAKSKKLKVIGKTSLVPNLCNINEPLVYGAPIAFNPILMLPMWICGLVCPALTWLVVHFGLVPIPTQIFAFWYLPFPFITWAIGGLNGVLFSIVEFALTAVIYYPFFKVYDNQCVLEEQNENK